MKPQELYDLKRKNFIEKVKKYFEFLKLEYNYNYKNCMQPNKVVTQDLFEFIGDKNKIIISNSYHPVDYGFEINIIDLKTEKKEMIYFKLKEEQDIEQKYIIEASEVLKKFINNTKFLNKLPNIVSDSFFNDFIIRIKKEEWLTEEFISKDNKDLIRNKITDKIYLSDLMKELNTTEVGTLTFDDDKFRENIFALKAFRVYLYGEINADNSIKSLGIYKSEFIDNVEWIKRFKNKMKLNLFIDGKLR